MGKSCSNVKICFLGKKKKYTYTANDYKTIIRKFFCNFCIQENSDKTKGMFFQAMQNIICKQCAPVKPLYLQRVQFPAIFIGAGHRVFCRSTYRLNMKNGLNFSFYLRAKPNFYFNHMHYVLRVLKTSLWNPMCQTYVFKTKIA